MKNSPSRADPGRREKTDLDFYFRTSSQRSVKIKITLIFYLMQLSEMPGVGRVNISEKLWVSVVKPVEDRLVGGFLNIGSSHGYFSIIV